MLLVIRFIQSLPKVSKSLDKTEHPTLRPMQSGMFVHKSGVYVTGMDASVTVSLFFLEGSSEAADTPTHDSD